jgi:hypothetical protein
MHTVHTKIADAIKYKTKISSTFSHLIENAKGSWLGSQFRKITPYQWMPGLPRCAFVTEIYMNSGIYKTVYGPEMKRSDTYEYDQWRCLNRENVEHFLRSQLLNAKVVQELLVLYLIASAIFVCTTFDVGPVRNFVNRSPFSAFFHRSTN